MPSVDFSEMEAGQSEIRNRTLAPVFKRLGIIEQWGNGLKLIAEELQNYPEIKFEWKEPGIAFRVTFTKTIFKQQQELQQETLYSRLLRLLAVKISSTKELSFALGQKEISGQLYSIINKLREHRLIEWTIPDKPKSSKQKYQITQRGNIFLQLIIDNDLKNHGN